MLLDEGSIPGKWFFDGLRAIVSTLATGRSIQREIEEGSGLPE